MRLLIVGGTPAHRGGVEQFCDRAREAIAAEGHSVALLPSHAAYLRLRSLPRFIAVAWRLMRERRRGWDAVWLQYTSLPDLALLAVGRLAGHRMLVTPHLGKGWASQSRPVMRWLGTRVLGLAHGIGLLAASQAEELALPTGPARFALRTFLPRHFPPPARRGPKDPTRLVHAGRLSAGKGSFVVLDVCEHLLRVGAVFEATLIGPCDQAVADRLRARIATAGLEGHVRLHGAMPEAELMQQLAAADVLIHPSQIDSYPLIVLESVGCGTFPVCIDLAGARLITRTYCGCIVPPENAAEAMATSILSRKLGDIRHEADAARIRLLDDFHWAACVTALECAVTALQSDRTGRR